MRPLPIVAATERAVSDRAPDDNSLADLASTDLVPLLEAFYARVTVDPVLAPYFAGIDMAHHIPRIAAFWSTLVFHTGDYEGNAFAPHLKMPGLAAEHFARWLEAFEQVMDARHRGPFAEHAKQLAHRIAFSMQLRLGVVPRDVASPRAVPDE